MFPRRPPAHKLPPPAFADQKAPQPDPAADSLSTQSFDGQDPTVKLMDGAPAPEALLTTPDGAQLLGAPMLEDVTVGAAPAPAPEGLLPDGGADLAQEPAAAPAAGAAQAPAAAPAP